MKVWGKMLKIIALLMMVLWENWLDLLKAFWVKAPIMFLLASSTTTSKLGTPTKYSVTGLLGLLADV